MSIEEFSKLPVIDIIILCTMITVWLVGWVCIIINAVISLIECHKCIWRKQCGFLIFSEHCPKRYCLNEKEREEFRKKIKEQD